MNWKETLTFPPEVPISDKAKDLILRCQPYGFPVNRVLIFLSGRLCCVPLTGCFTWKKNPDGCDNCILWYTRASSAELPCRIHLSLRGHLLEPRLNYTKKELPCKCYWSGKKIMFLLFICLWANRGSNFIFLPELPSYNSDGFDIVCTGAYKRIPVHADSCSFMYIFNHVSILRTEI